MIDVEKILTDFCREYHLNIHFSADMPKGYETANGTFDITKNTLFFNTAMLAEAPNYEVLFYLFHELRHALQYTCPQLFSEVLRLSLDYVLMYDGTCYKKVDGDWVECKLEGTEQYLSNAYLGQPYEEDANHFAYEQVKRMLGTSKDLDELYSFWIPKKRLSDGEYIRLYKEIDTKICNQIRSESNEKDQATRKV